MKVCTHMKEGASEDNFLVIISSLLVSCWESTLSRTTSVALAETYRCRRVRVFFLRWASSALVRGVVVTFKL